MINIFFYYFLLESKKIPYFQVNFTHILDFEHLYEDMVEMLPDKQQLFKEYRLDTIKQNVNKKGPVTDKDILRQFGTLRPNLYQRLRKFYEKDFKVFGYTYPNIQWNGSKKISTSKPHVIV